MQILYCLAMSIHPILIPCMKRYENVAKLCDYEQISHKILQCDKREIKNVRYLYEIRIKTVFFSSMIFLLVELL